ncbi:MAG: hypothetical protein M3P84_13140 [Chloroflexota bacterium]|nr:hypothetical protein [Chloroflexota bacterium]
MTEPYTWFVFLHLAGLVVFVAAHGFSMFVAYRIRAERDRAAVMANLAWSQTATRVATVGLVAMLVGGAGAATISGVWARTWIVGSIVVLVVVIAGMYGVGARYYYALRERLTPKAGSGTAPIGDAELAELLDSRVPDILTAIGGVGLLVLVWLMVFKPG